MIFSNLLSKPYTLNQEVQGGPPPTGPTPYSQGQYNYMEADPYYYRVGFGLRFLAAFLDMIILWIITSFALEWSMPEEVSQSLMDYTKEMQGNPEAAVKFISFIEENLFQYYLISFALVLIYYLPEMMFGWSIGKFLVRIKIGSDMNTNAAPGQLAMRYLLKNSSTITFLIPLMIGSFTLMLIPSLIGLVVFVAYFFMLTDRKQTLYDRMAKTAVYRIKELNYLIDYQQNEVNQGTE